MKESRIIVALDVPSFAQAVGLIEKLRYQVYAFKVGLELISAEGAPNLIKMLNELDVRFFLDVKLMDIPNTVAGAVRAIIGCGKVDMLNVHCTGGVNMMKAAVEAAVNATALEISRRPKILGVTILTSIRYDDLMQMGLRSLNDLRIDQSDGEAMSKIVANLALLAQESGLDGVIASPQEVLAIREKCGKKLIIITPGVRPSWAPANDQKRVATPAEAILAGANYVVVGRPITNPPEEIHLPENAAYLINNEINQALAA